MSASDPRAELLTETLSGPLIPWLRQLTLQKFGFDHSQEQLCLALIAVIFINLLLIHFTWQRFGDRISQRFQQVDSVSIPPETLQSGKFLSSLIAVIFDLTIFFYFLILITQLTSSDLKWLP